MITRRLFNSILFFLLLLNVLIISQEKISKSSTLSKQSVTPKYAKFNCNNISTFIYNNGFADIDSSFMSWGFIFPIGSKKNLVYQSGLILGGMLKDKSNVNNVSKIVLTGSMYKSWMNPGKILSNGNAEDPASETARVFKVRNKINQSVLEVEAYDEKKAMEQIINQYKKDREEWRASDGAPFVDVNNNGKYEPYIDLPGIEDAEQTLWFVANDIGFNEFEGVELQATIWGYKKDDFLDNIIFKKYKIINKNKDKDSIKNAYIGYWSDADIGGNAGDDLVGCDTLYQLGFIYNGKDIDTVYKNESAAYGSILLSGPWDADKKNYMSMSSFSTVEWLSLDYIESPPIEPIYYNFLRGLNQFGRNIVNPTTNVATKYMYPGNPYYLSGWYCTLMKDYRALISVGPFDLAYGDSQEIVIAQIAASYKTRLEALQRVRGFGLLTRTYFYENIMDKIFTGIVNEKNSNIPTQFILYQNYPNPFNPSTVISYQLAVSSFVTLKVYDLLGREVATLVDEYQQAGVYNSQFSILHSQFSSGIYFYTLKAGKYIETKKMVLTK